MREAGWVADESLNRHFIQYFGKVTAYKVFGV